MILKVNTTSGKPVYQQLMDQIKFAVASGRLAAGDRLPTVRDVAVQVRVNRNTVARVYAELEREGLLYTKAGQGTFVSDRGSGLSRAEQRRQLLPPIDDLLTQAKLFGLSRDQILNLFNDRMDAVYPAESETLSQPTGGKR